MENNNNQRFARYCERVRESYQSDSTRLSAFNDAVSFLTAHAVDYLENGMTARANGIAFAIDCNASQSLRVTHVASSNTATGYIRQLRELIQSITPSDNPCYCETCRRAHKKYGLEIEMKVMREELYRPVFLRKLNDNARISPSSDNFGIDGSGDPLEIRNINGADVNAVTSELSARLVKFTSTLEWFKNNFPDVPASISTRECGIHVHVFHKGVSRDKLLGAHGVIGMIINSYAPEDWQSRAVRGYGTLFNYRAINQGGGWCNNPNNATELRTFGVLMPNVLKFALDWQEKLLANPSRVTYRGYQDFLNRERIASHTIPQVTPFQKTLNWFIENGAITLEQVQEMATWLTTNYVPFHTNQEVNRGFLPAILSSLSRNGAPSVAVPAPSVPAVPASADNQSASRNTVWCARFREALRNIGQSVRIECQWFRPSIRRHLRSCARCRIAIEGYRVRTMSRNGTNVMYLVARRQARAVA